LAIKRNKILTHEVAWMNPENIPGAGGVAQAAECLSSKHKVLSSSLSSEKKLLSEKKNKS
jgi:hypothetical protein